MESTTSGAVCSTDEVVCTSLQQTEAAATDATGVRLGPELLPPAKPLLDIVSRAQLQRWAGLELGDAEAASAAQPSTAIGGLRIAHIMELVELTAPKPWGAHFKAAARGPARVFFAWLVQLGAPLPTIAVVEKQDFANFLSAVRKRLAEYETLDNIPLLGIYTQ